jgi:chromate transporter
MTSWSHHHERFLLSASRWGQRGQMDRRFERVLHTLREMVLRRVRVNEATRGSVCRAARTAVTTPPAGGRARVGPGLRTARLRELAAVFLRLGLTAFGGPAAHIAMMEDEAVGRRKWLTRERFLDLLGIANLLPGPSSSELAIYLEATFIGYLLAGWTGAAVATAGIFLPAFLLVAASGPFVPLLRDSRLVATILDGVNAGALALMAVVAWQLGRAAVVDVTTGVLAVAGAVLLLRLRLDSTWLILAGAGLGMALGVARVR